MSRVSAPGHVGRLRVLGQALVLGGLAFSPQVVRAGEAAARLDDGRVSATFVAASIDQVLAEIRRATGVEIVAPPSARGGQITLRAEREPLDQFLRRVISRLGLGGFAMIFEPNGTSGRIIIVDRARTDASSEMGSTPATSVISDPERMKALAPVVPPSVGPPLVQRDLEADKLAAMSRTPPVEASAESLQRAAQASKRALATIPLVRPAGPAQPGTAVYPFPAPDGALIPLD